VKRLAIILTICAVLTPSAAFAYPARVHKWEPVIRAACRYYHISAANTSWAVSKGLGIIYRESRGNTNTGHLNGCYGLWQFGSSWRHHITLGGVHYADFRRSGRGSCFRFVKVLHIGGRAAVSRAWAATLR
jgi:hypothetical protein